MTSARHDQPTTATAAATGVAANSAVAASIAATGVAANSAVAASIAATGVAANSAAAASIAATGVAANSAAAARRAFVALGSNLGDRMAHLRGAVGGLDGVVACSDVYETKPVGGPEQGPYLNMVVRLRTAAGARALLAQCRAVELDAGRVRVVRWGPRTLDADVLWIDGEQVDHPDLEVPHPRMYERDFVLVPLADVGPDLLPDGFDPEAAEGIVRLGPLVR